MNKGSPSYRVRRALRRISRSQWLDPESLGKTGYRLCQCASFSDSSAWTVFHAAIPDACLFVGMIKGEPPCHRFEDKYLKILSIVRNRNKRNNTETLIKLTRAIGDIYENNR